MNTARDCRRTKGNRSQLPNGQQRLLPIWLGVLAMAAAGCTTTWTSALEDSNCVPPCWRGINPGATTLEEAKEAISSMVDVDHRSLVSGDGVSFRFSRQVGEQSADLEVKQGIITSITFRMGQTIRLQQLLAITGEPSLVCAASWWSDHRWLTVDMLDPLSGFALSFRDDWFRTEASTTTITGDEPVDTVVFFNPSEYTDLLKNGHLTQAPATADAQCLTQWNGFGTFPVAEALGE